MVKILIVEDNPRNMRLMEQIIMDISDDIELIKSTSGFEVIEKAKKIKPDLVLLDIALPDMDGFQIRNKLMEYPLFKNIPFIAVTAYAATTDKESIKKSFDYYISKPIDEDNLIDIVKSAVGCKL